MDSYFRSIGFSRLKTKNQIKKLNDEVLEAPDSRFILSQSTESIHIEYYKEYAENMGVSVRGIMNEKEDVVVESLKPYLFTNNIISISNISIESFGKEYVVTCEEDETGNELSFYMQNALDFVDNEKQTTISKVNVVGLSEHGTVILPIEKDKEYFAVKNEENKAYRDLVKRARYGDFEAEKQLAIFTEETNKIIKERLKEEDFLSVVESYFVRGCENNAQYSLLGDIENFTKISNTETAENLYLLMLDITGTKLEVCINEKDLQGMPFVGMRFMGQCWLQGKVIY